MAFNPTNEQKSAIYAPSGTLVSAAAGSGKTAVLVERVIEKITGTNAVDADKLLVVTYTNSAAQEMRIRIEGRLNEECRKNPKNRELLKQKIRIKNAKICTIDSFCIDLIRENFDRLDINPDFRIADAGILESLRGNAMNETLDEAFEENSDSFKALLAAICGDYDDGEIRKNIEELFSYSETMPFPEEFLRQLYEMADSESVFDELANIAFSDAESLLGRLKLSNNAVLELLTEDETFYKKFSAAYLDDLSDIEMLLSAAKNRDWNGMFTSLSRVNSTRIGSARVDKTLPLCSAADYVRKSVKAQMLSLAGVFSAPKKEAYADFVKGTRFSRELVRLTITYAQKLKALCREKNIMDFADVEHAALNLLCEYKDGIATVKDSAKDIIDRFSEVMVDEFQDANNLQDMLFSALAANEKKLFVVGDVKQSIYRFRGANPGNFLEKKRRYKDYETANADELKKIILSGNFRSRKGVCDFVNFVFETVMNGSLSEISYTAAERLSPLGEFKEIAQNAVEISLCDVEYANDSKKVDAICVAAFIERYMKEGLVTDASGELRKPQYSDFTVLLRAVKSDGEVYAKALRSRGIPVTFSSENFLAKTEIRNMLSLLSVIENTTRDIDLLAVLMSPMFGFSADEIAEIRLADKSVSLISALAVYSEKSDKAESFLKTLSRFKNYFVSKNISGLIRSVYDDTDYLNIVGVLENGQARRNNLLTLLNLAESFDSYGFTKNISAFIAHVEKMAGEKMKNSSAAENAVKITTIHDSKGLQYPICILANTVSKFKSAASEGTVLTDDALGAAIRFKEGKDTLSYITHDIIAKRKNAEQLDEEMRLMYVALTRAKDKLFISITRKDSLKFIKDMYGFIAKSENIDQYRAYAGEFDSYADLICFALAVHPSANKFRTADGVAGFYHLSDTQIDLTHSVETLPNQENEEEHQLIPEQNAMADEALSQKIKESIAYEYPYCALKNIESKAAVAELAHKAETRDFSFTAKPAFMAKKGLSAAGVGTATHRFMQFCDFSRAKTDIRDEAHRLYDFEFITQTEYEALDLNRISNFFSSSLFGRIERADRIEREMRFITEITAGEINEDIPADIADEGIVVQGSVDCVFIENNSLVILDFKTDRITDEKQLSAAYSEQLNIYAKACEKIFELPVRQKLIYSFALNREIIVE